MLLEWEERPQDVANLLNPAFDGFLLHRAISGFEKEANAGMPFELAFVVLPFVLHEPTRNRLPAKVTTHLATWLQEERDVLLGFAERTADLTPYTQEAMLFLLTHDLAVVEEDGRCRTGSGGFRRGVGPYSQSSGEIHRCYRAALSVGRWLAVSGNATTIYALLGIRP